MLWFGIQLAEDWNIQPLCWRRTKQMCSYPNPTTGDVGFKGPRGATGPGGAVGIGGVNTLGDMLDVTLTPNPLSIGDNGSFLLFDGTQWINAGVTHPIVIGGPVSIDSLTTTQIGESSQATMIESTLVGQGSISSGSRTVSLGNQTDIQSNECIAIGRNIVIDALSDECIGIGHVINVTASSQSVMIGTSLTSSGSKSTISGRNISSRSNNIIMGTACTSVADDVTMIGNAILTDKSDSISIGVFGASSSVGEIVLSTPLHVISVTTSGIFFTGIPPNTGGLFNTFSWDSATPNINVLTYNTISSELQFNSVVLAP